MSGFDICVPLDHTPDYNESCCADKTVQNHMQPGDKY